MAVAVVIRHQAMMSAALVILNMMSPLGWVVYFLLSALGWVDEPGELALPRLL